MKKFAFFIPVLIFLAFTMVSSRLFAAGTVSPATLVLMILPVLLISLLLRPKKNAAPKASFDVEAQVRGDFAPDAFTGSDRKDKLFQGAMKDYCTNCPKAALTKLTKLAPLCSNDQETYAAAMLTALCCITVQKFPEALRQYTTAIVLHPTADLALALGSCHQRLGELRQAKDSYQFALELDARCLEARCALATACVADRSYQEGLQHAMLALEQEENQPSALATAAICHGLLGDSLLQKHYTQKAVENGYKEEKITSTISALKKG